MKFNNINTISNKVKNQLNEFVSIWREQLSEHIVGIYLHGSMVLNCFVEETSDLDILVVVDDRIDRKKRLEIAEKMISIDGKPCPVEVSAVQKKDIAPWKNPPICQFHYSDFWTKRYQEVLDGKSTECYVADNDFPDADVVSYIKLICQCGVVLYGKPIAEVFPEVSDTEFFDAIREEVDEYDFHAYNERYFSSNILILARIFSYAIARKILSKYEGALLAAEYVPAHLKYIIQDAAKVWYDGKELVPYPEEELTELRNFLVEKIKHAELR